MFCSFGETRVASATFFDSRVIDLSRSYPNGANCMSLAVIGSYNTIILKIILRFLLRAASLVIRESSNIHR